MSNKRLPVCKPARSAFTLIELLVVIVIIVLLISILLPALKEAMFVARMMKEQASGQQQMVAHSAYATENRDAVFSGYQSWAVTHMANADVPADRCWLSPDPYLRGYFIDGDVGKTAGYRWMGSSGLPLEAMLTDRAWFRTVSTRSTTPSRTFPNNKPPMVWYDGNVNTIPAAVAYNPSLGGNYTFIGGNWHRGAYIGYSPRAVNTVVGHPPKKFYVTHLHEITVNPSRLVMFASSRGVDIRTTSSFGSHSWGRNPFPYNAANVVPGFWEITAPIGTFLKGAAAGWANSPQFDWNTSDTWNPNTNPTTWGYLDFRWKRKAVTANMDGHVEMQTIKQLRDMRKWANPANRADWTMTFP